MATPPITTADRDYLVRDLGWVRVSRSNPAMTLDDLTEIHSRLERLIETQRVAVEEHARAEADRRQARGFFE